ncbi:MAG: TIGR00341 family protein [Pseudomonadota bacterium]
MRRLDIHLRDGDAYEMVIRVVKAAEPVDYIVVPLERQNRRLISVFVRDGTGQTLMDNIQSCLEREKDWRVALFAIEATAPQIEETAPKRASTRGQKALREEIYTGVAKGTKLDGDYLLFVVLSTIVAGIGLNSDGVAAVIGAMVIAPLLGPILGFALGVALGDRELLGRAGLTLTAGIALCLGTSLALSFALPINLESRELLSRAEVRLDGVALAMAAGGAAALSTARGVGSALVGVMVAAALLPPAASVGLFAGDGRWPLAGRAGLLLLLNIASLILAALIVFRFKGIRPRTWIEQKDASRAMAINAGLSVVFLVLCAALILILDLGERVSFG